jgi:O-antigen ligase
VIFNLNSIDRLRDAVTALMVGLLLQSAISVLQYTFAFDFGGLSYTVGEVRRVSGTIGWPNTFGAYTASIVAIVLVLWLCQSGIKTKIPTWLVGIAGCFPLLLTFSRGSWGAFGISMVIAWLLGIYFRWINRASALRLIIILSCSAVIISLLIGPISERLVAQTLDVRWDLNRVSLNMIEAQPVLGVGINTFTDVMRAYDTSGVTYDFPQPVHDVYLLIAAETGLVGLAAFLLLVTVVFWTGLKTIKAGNRTLSVSTIAILGGLLVLLVSNTADVHLRTDVLAALFWLFLSMVIALNEMAQHENRSSDLQPE